MDFSHVIEHHILDEVWMRLPIFNGLLPWSKHVLMLGIAAAILMVFLPLAVRGMLGVMAKGFVEAIVLFIRDEILEPNLGHAGHQYLGYFCSLFFFILTCNLLGLIPFGATATGNIAVTMALATTTFCLIHIAGIREQGFGHYMHSIVPSGVPLWLWPLLFPIELIGFVAKAFALCIRLFANMVAGHIVILALMGLIFVVGAANPYIGLGVAAPVAMGMVLFVMCLELFVAFLQAYIFVFLTAIFVGGAVHPH